jgi:predicted AlkP superfamily phosphohydrolase/phosphomutase
MIIGLDCAEPSLVFDRWADRLPNLTGLAERGRHGPLASTVPPITIPAWPAMLTSRDPGALGLYGFRNRIDHSYAQLEVASSLRLDRPALDQILSRRRMTSIMLGVPLTYPPRPLRGLMVSGPLTPGRDAEFTFPPHLKAELDRAAGGRYRIDVSGFRTADKDGLIDALNRTTDARFQAAGHLIDYYDWDLFMMVEMGVDRVQHGFWRFSDPAHRAWRPGHRYENVILDYYRRVDRWVGRLIDRAPPETLILVVSDHGAQALEGGFALNQWLIEQGHLRLIRTPDPPRRPYPDLIDWPNTAAWAEGGYFGRVFVNQAGREPQGTVPADRREAFLDRLTAEVEAIVKPDGSPMGNRVLRPERIYREARGVPPDLMVFLGDLTWRAAAPAGAGQPLYLTENDTGPDDANHAPHGVFIGAVKDRPLLAGRLDGLTLYDVAPTVLDYLGVDPPPDMIGRSIARSAGFC